MAARKVTVTDALRLSRLHNLLLATVLCAAGAGVLLWRPFGGAVTGRVTVAGRPFAGAEVTLFVQQVEEPEGSISARTNGDGKYRVEAIDPAVMTVFATVFNQRTRVIKDVVVSAGRTAVVNFEFPEGNAAIGGQVLLNGETPKEMHVNVWNEAEQWRSWEKTTATYLSPGLPAGTWSVAAEIAANEEQGHHGYSARREVELVAGQTLKLNFDFPDAAD